MRVVIQRVSKASVTVEGKVVGKIGPGFLLWLALLMMIHQRILISGKKIVNMRIFEDENGKMNISLLQKGYEILSVSQFTLYAQTHNGNRPGFGRSKT